MSVEVRIPKEICEYTEKIIGGLSIRQLIAFTVAIISGVSSYFITRFYFGASLAGDVCIIVVLPIFAVGFIKKNGLTFEKYAALILRHKFGKNKRKYKTDLFIDMIVSTDTSKGVNKNVVSKTAKEKGDKGEGSVYLPADPKRKIKEARQTIRDAKQGYRKAKKGIKEKQKTDNSAADNKI
jgi:hypothetical protein